MAEQAGAPAEEEDQRIPLYLVSQGRDPLEYNLAKFKENVQNAGRYPSMDDEQQPMQPGEGATSQFKLHLSTKSGTEWEGELLNRDYVRNYRSAPKNYYMMLKRDPDKKYGRKGRLVVQMVRHQFLFGRKRDIKTKNVEEQEKEAKKELETLEKQERKALLKGGGAGGPLHKRARKEVPKISATGELVPPSPPRDELRKGHQGDRDSMWKVYDKQPGGMSNSAALVKADAWRKEDEELDFGDADLDDCGGDNEGMEENPEDNLDVDMGQEHGGRISDDDDDDSDGNDDLTVRRAETDEENDSGDEKEEDEEQEQDEEARFKELLGKYHAKIVTDSMHPLKKQVAEEVFEHFLRKNNLSNTVPQGRAEFLGHLRAWDNSSTRRQLLLGTCTNFIRVEREKAQNTITLETIRAIFRRCTGGVGPAFKLSKERIIENLRKDVGNKLYREQKSKVDQLFRESMQREMDETAGQVVFSLATA